MRLPHAERAIVEIAKLREYCLSSSHPRGRHKARVFFAALGITDADAEELQAALVRAAVQEIAVPGMADRFGTRYVIDFKLERDQRTATIRSSWIVPKDGLYPRFITCFVI